MATYQTTSYPGQNPVQVLVVETMADPWLPSFSPSSLFCLLSNKIRPEGCCDG